MLCFSSTTFEILPLPTSIFSQSWAGCGRPFKLLVSILRRAFADLLGHFRVLSAHNLVLDGFDVDLVPPVVTKVEQIAKAATNFQTERVDGRFSHKAPHVIVSGVSQDVDRP